MDNAIGDAEPLVPLNSKIELLIIDDDAELAASIGDLICSRLKANITVVTSVAEATDLLEKRKSERFKVDIIVSDYQLVGETANSLLVFLNSHQMKIPLIMITGALEVQLSPYPFLFGICQKPKLFGLFENLALLQLRRLK